MTPRYRTLVVSDLQFDSFASSCFVGKLWWIGPLCTFSSLGTVSIVRCSTCHYWASRFIHFHSTRLRVLITLSVFASSIIRTTAGSATSFTVDLDLQFFSFAPACFGGKLWWIGPLCRFSSLGTVSIVRCSTCLYWASRSIHFLSTRLGVLITLLFPSFDLCSSTEILSTNLLLLSHCSCWCCRHESQGRFPRRSQIICSFEFG